jgi:hypothetical protein
MYHVEEMLRIQFLFEVSLLQKLLEPIFVKVNHYDI